jgi:DNA-binding beta-propeller fold protein YncE
MKFVKIGVFVVIGCVLVCFNSGLPAAFAQQTYLFVTKWGSLGNYDGMLNLPASLAVDSSGNLYVTDTNNNRIEKFSSDGKFLSKWGTYGSSPGQLNLPTGIAIDSSGNIFVTDQSNNRIQEFDGLENYVKEFQLSQLFPRGLAVDSTGNIYFTEPARDILVKLANNGDELARLGSHGTQTGEFDTPTAVALDGKANVYVVDTGNNRIQKFTSSGQFLASWGSPGTANGQFNTPQGIGIDSDGNVYVADTGNNRIQKFTTDGKFLTSWGSHGRGNGQFLSPTGIAIDLAGNVYVSDSDFDYPSIQKFSTGNLTSASNTQKNTVPEFGSTASITLAVTVLSMLILTTFKLRFNN